MFFSDCTPQKPRLRRRLFIYMLDSVADNQRLDRIWLYSCSNPLDCLVENHSLFWYYWLFTCKIKLTDLIY